MGKMKKLKKTRQMKKPVGMGLGGGRGKRSNSIKSKKKRFQRSAKRGGPSGPPSDQYAGEALL